MRPFIAGLGTFCGPLVLPTISQVKSGVVFGPASSLTGAYSEAAISVADLVPDSMAAIIDNFGQQVTYTHADGTVRVISGVISYDPKPQSAGPQARGPEFTVLVYKGEQFGVPIEDIKIGKDSVTFDILAGAAETRIVREIRIADTECLELIAR